MQQSSGRNLVIIIAILILGASMLVAGTIFVAREPSTPADTSSPADSTVSEEGSSELPNVGDRQGDVGQKQASFEVEAPVLKLPPLDYGSL